MKVKLVKEHGLKVWHNFEEHRGKVFQVVSKLVPGDNGKLIELGNLGNGGYYVDLAPLGHPGVWGFMYDDEVEIVDDSTPVSVMKTEKKNISLYDIGLFIERFPKKVKEWFVKLFEN
jgi:hypothetical protein